MPGVAYLRGKSQALFDLGVEDQQKTAVLGHALLGGIAGHIGVNAAGRMASKATNIGEVLAHKGLQHGFLDSIVSPGAMRSIKSIAGPESMAVYEVANQAGRRLAAVSPKRRPAVIKELLKDSGNMSAPVIKELRTALSHHAANTAPTLKAKGVGAKAYAGAMDKITDNVQKPFDTSTQKAVKNIAGLSPAAGLVAADTAGGATHIGVNAIREGLGRSSIGKKFMQRNFSRGLGGDIISPIKETATDYLVSPGFLLPYRVGKSIRDFAPNNLRGQFTEDNLSKGLEAVSGMLPKQKF